MSGKNRNIHLRMTMYSRRIYRRLLTVLFLSIICIELSYGSTPPSHTNVSYILDMSADDGLCQPILHFYNSHLNDRDSENLGFIEDRFRIGEDVSGPEFLINKYGDWNTEIFKDLDIFNNGTKKNVAVIDRGINYQFITFGTELIVTGIGTEYVPGLHPSSDGVDAWIQFPQGPQIKNVESAYPLRKYSDFNQRQLAWDAMDLSARSKNIEVAPPHMGDPANGQRLLRYHDEIYVAARDRMFGSLPSNIGLRIIVYKLSPTGIPDDVCYFRLGNDQISTKKGQK